MRITALIIALLWALWPARAADAQSAAGSVSAPVVLDVEGGDTAFAISADRSEAWWLKGECRAAIPLDAGRSGSDMLLGIPQTEDVTLGDRQLRLTQQFRFDFQADTVTVSIFSSVRGGWATVPTKRDRACEASACRSRMELPEC